MKKTIFSFLIFSILITACSASPTETAEPVSANEWWVENPTTGDLQYVKRYTPKLLIDEALQTLVLVPGGNGDSSSFTKKKKSAQDLANEGFIVITFDPLGTGQSEGEMDQWGFADQDGLNAIIDSLEEDSVGLVTFSYGITMGSGMLARYPDSPVDFLIDWEGPADRTDTGGCDEEKTGHLIGLAECDDESYWSEREALTFISQIERPYIRLQSEKDHVQPDHTHAEKMVEAALAGKAEFVGYNSAESIESFDETTPLPESAEKTLMLRISEIAHELF